jgi:thioredoxin reductase (NADPH)
MEEQTNTTNTTNISQNSKLQEIIDIANKVFDIGIIGGGPAGLSCAIYAGRYLLKTAIFTQIKGGAIIDTTSVENYPGIIKTTGFDLMQTMYQQAKNFGAQVFEDEVVSFDKNENFFTITTKSNGKFTARSILLATGLSRRKLNIPNEDKFIGKGLSYCATCDAFFFKGKTVGVVGGGNSAAVAALLLKDYAQKLYIIQKYSELKCEPYWKQQIESSPNIEQITNVKIESVIGEEMVEGIVLDNGLTVKLDGIFVETGSTPLASLAKMLGIKMDEQGFILVDEHMKTNIDLVYSAGDITTGSAKLRQIVTAASEGAIAATSIYKALKEKEGNKGKTVPNGY